MSQRVEDMVAANKSLLQQRQALRLELQLQQEMQQQQVPPRPESPADLPPTSPAPALTWPAARRCSQVQRALASRQLSRTVAEARAQDEEALQAARQQLAHSRTELQDRDDQVAARPPPPAAGPAAAPPHPPTGRATGRAAPAPPWRAGGQAAGAAAAGAPAG